MLVVPEQTYPLICVAVSKGTELNQVVRFGTVNPNTTSSWFTESGWNSERSFVFIELYFEAPFSPRSFTCCLVQAWSLNQMLCPHFSVCRHTADLCDPRHSARERHHPGLPGPWVTNAFFPVCASALCSFDYSRSEFKHFKYFIGLCLLSPLCSPFLYAGCIKIVNLQGRLKSSRKLSAELTFNFQIESTGKEKSHFLLWITTILLVPWRPGPHRAVNWKNGNYFLNRLIQLYKPICNS